MVDGVNGEVILTLVEDNPEDWAGLEPSEFDATLDALG